MLLAAARTHMPDDAGFTIAALLADSGIDRTQFLRCFTGKKQLMEALALADLQALDGILVAAQPLEKIQDEEIQSGQIHAVEIRQAVGSNIAAAAPATPMSSIADAWLERRLRVFERALMGLEKRQDKSEQDISLRVAIVEENMAGLTARAAPQAPVIAALKSNPVLATPAAIEPQAEQTEPAPALMPVQQIVAPDPREEPVTEKEMADFLAHARQAARNAMPPEPPPKRRRRPGPMREAMLLAGMLIGGLLLIGTVLLFATGMPQTATASTIRYRQMTQGEARIMALADNGDPKAETMLALAYLHQANEQAGMRWSSAAAAQGQPVAQYLLGTLYLTRDHVQALRWLSAAARQGNVKAMHNLAIAYAQGPTPDAALAVQWFAKAAALGYRDSQFDLAVLYERGSGVTQRGAEALKWYLIAAAGGDAPSASRAAILKDQIPAADVRKAMAEAAAFVPGPASRAANEPPNI
jgi:TPR repeat protein